MRRVDTPIHTPVPGERRHGCRSVGLRSRVEPANVGCVATAARLLRRWEEVSTRRELLRRRQGVRAVKLVREALLQRVTCRRVPHACRFHRDGRPVAPSEWPLARSLSSGGAVSNEDFDVEFEDGEGGVTCIDRVRHHRVPPTWVQVAEVSCEYARHRCTRALRPTHR